LEEVTNICTDMVRWTFALMADGYIMLKTLVLFDHWRYTALGKVSAWIDDCWTRSHAFGWDSSDGDWLWSL